jgi:hypothetical protein
MKSGPESPSSSRDARDRADRRAGTGAIARASSSAPMRDASESEPFISYFAPAGCSIFFTIIINVKKFHRRFARSELGGNV